MRHEWLIVFLAVALVAWAAPTRADTPEIKEGSKLPTIELPVANVGSILPEKKDVKTLNLREIKGKNIVLFLFPKAMTKG